MSGFSRDPDERLKEASDDQIMAFARKNWERHVDDAEQLARGLGFQVLRDRIVQLAGLARGEVVVDLGAGTGLLTLAVARGVRKVWAVDSSRAMGEYLRVKAESAELDNVRVVHAAATNMPLVDRVADVVLSSYCFHEMRERDKRRALHEAFRVLRPGGRLVIGDMMFSLNPFIPRDRLVVGRALRSIGRRGLPGLLRILKNALRLATGRWEHPETAAWWRAALEQCGFEEISIELLSHEGGIATARRPITDKINPRGRVGGVARNQQTLSTTTALHQNQCLAANATIGYPRRPASARARRSFLPALSGGDSRIATRRV